MKNIVLKTITCIAAVILALGCCAMEMTPVVAAMLFGPLAWLLPYSIVNRGALV